MEDFGLEAPVAPGSDLTFETQTPPSQGGLGTAALTNAMKTSLFTASLSLTAIILSAYTQIRGQSSLDAPASYLDPLLIDVLAFCAASFLVIEGITRLAQNRNRPLLSQLTRTFRVAIGFGVMTIHVIQFLHK